MIRISGPLRSGTQRWNVRSHNRVLITGAGGFIGGHLVAEFRKLGYRKIRAVDVKPLEDWY